MSNDEMRQLFDAVLTSPSPDRTDIDHAIRVARRRRRHRHSRAAVLAGVGLVAATVVAAVVFRSGAVTPQPIGGPHATTGAAITPTSSPSPTFKPVTSTRELLGHWLTIELEGQDAESVRDSIGTPLTIWFQGGEQPSWGAYDGCNWHQGRLTVAATGRFTASQGGGTLRLCLEQSPTRNVDVVMEADQARIVPATATTPRRLLLLAKGVVIGQYADAQITLAAPG